MNYAVLNPYREAVVAEFQFHNYLRVVTLGGKHAAHDAALWFAKTNHLTLASIVQPPSSAAGTGFKEIVALSKLPITYGDGVLVPSNTAVGIGSRDCPIVVLYNSYRPTTVVCHAGRPALSRGTAGEITVLNAAIDAVTNHDSSQRCYVRAYVTAGICADCLVHEGKGAETYLAPFRRYHPNAIGARGRLDLHKVIRCELEQLGVPNTNIVVDTTCTKEHSAMSSHRNGDAVNNIVLVLQH